MVEFQLQPPTETVLCQLIQQELWGTTLKIHAKQFKLNFGIYLVFLLRQISVHIKTELYGKLPPSNMGKRPDTFSIFIASFTLVNFCFDMH